MNLTLWPLDSSLGSFWFDDRVLAQAVSQPCQWLTCPDRDTRQQTWNNKQSGIFIWKKKNNEEYFHLGWDMSNFRIIFYFPHTFFTFYIVMNPLHYFDELGTVVKTLFSIDFFFFFIFILYLMPSLNSRSIEKILWDWLATFILNVLSALL